jgi:AmmeMemoRadiSam system protein B
MKVLMTIICVCVFIILHCGKKTDKELNQNVRYPVDTIGYAHTAAQMDSLLSRINRIYGKERETILSIQNINPAQNWQAVISPHDDYSYAGEMYTYVLKNVKTPVIIIFGVAHKAQSFGIADKLVFETFSSWKGPYGNIPVSDLRTDIISQIPEGFYIISDTLHQVEHSIEAQLPFLQYYQNSLKIVPILVPFMNFSRMEQIASAVSEAIFKAGRQRQWEWGTDYSFVISSDCVHYGDENWDGKAFAPFGADTAGYRRAKNYDMNIISECLIDRLHQQRIKRFFEYTVDRNNYKEYDWTWCGRYSIPFGLLTIYHLQKMLKITAMEGNMLRYSTSISHLPIPVADLGLGTTAPANIHHWVGYVSLGYQSQ